MGRGKGCTEGRDQGSGIRGKYQGTAKCGCWICGCLVWEARRFRNAESWIEGGFDWGGCAELRGCGSDCCGDADAYRGGNCLRGGGWTDSDDGLLRPEGRGRAPDRDHHSWGRVSRRRLEERERGVCGGLSGAGRVCGVFDQLQAGAEVSVSLYGARYREGSAVYPA